MDAAHKIVSGRANGNWLVDRVDEVELYSDLSNHGQSFINLSGAEMTQVNVNVVEAIGSWDILCPLRFQLSRSERRCLEVPPPSWMERIFP